MSLEPEKLSKFRQFGYGAAGALLPIAMNLLLVDFSTVEWLNFLFFFLSRLALFAVIAGIVSALLAPTIATKTNCFMVGLSITLVLGVVIEVQVV
ncbi:MAG: hypothetical protein K2P83_09695 [Nitrosomonas sp.]|nr:hypothetical protein [Nitrosomonas sp.]